MHESDTPIFSWRMMMGWEVSIRNNLCGQNSNFATNQPITTGIKLMKFINKFLQPKFKTMLTFGVQTSGASEVGVSVIVTTTAEEQEVVCPSPCVRGIIIVGWRDDITEPGEWLTEDIWSAPIWLQEGVMEIWTCWDLMKVKLIYFIIFALF